MTTYTQLQADVDQLYGRSVFQDVLMRIAEPKIRRRVRVREMETTTQLVCNSRTTTLPTDYLALRALTLDSALGRDIQYLTPERIREAPIWNNQGGGLTDNTALAVSIEGNAITLAPAPSAGAPVTLDIVYFAQFASLSAGTDTNWLLTNAYDVYLWAVLFAAADWDEDDVLAEKFERRFENAVLELEESDRRGRFPGGKALVATGSPRAVV